MMEQPRRVSVMKVVASVVVFGLVALPSAVIANQLFVDWVPVYSDGGNCLEVKPVQDHARNTYDEHVDSHDGGDFLTQARYKVPATIPFIGTFNCSAGQDLGPGYIRTKHTVKSRSGGVWGVCFSTIWLENSTQTSTQDDRIWLDYAPDPFPHSTAACGSRMYKFTAHGNVKNAGTWYGGPVAIEEYYILPDPPCKTCTAEHL